LNPEIVGLASLDISRSGVSKIEVRLRHVDDKSIMFLAELLNVPLGELFRNAFNARRAPCVRKSFSSVGFYGQPKNRPILCVALA